MWPTAIRVLVVTPSVMCNETPVVLCNEGNLNPIAEVEHEWWALGCQSGTSVDTVCGAYRGDWTTYADRTGAAAQDDHHGRGGTYLLEFGKVEAMVTLFDKQVCI